MAFMASPTKFQWSERAVSALMAARLLARSSSSCLCSEVKLAVAAIHASSFSKEDNLATAPCPSPAQGAAQARRLRRQRSSARRCCGRATSSLPACAPALRCQHGSQARAAGPEWVSRSRSARSRSPRSARRWDGRGAKVSKMFKRRAAISFSILPSAQTVSN